MGLNRELRNINAELLTAKQERQLERLENKQKKNLDQDLQAFLIYHFKKYFDVNFVVYKNKLFTNELKTQLKKGALAELGFYNSNEYLLQIFDDVYIKTAKKVIKEHELFNDKPPAPAVTSNKTKNTLNPLLIPILFIFHFVNILNVLLAGFNTTSKRRL